ncbi:MAG: hypothetical protein NC094_08920 [Bacteroidales bacterium]|nr:hypothetical protein [Lachnoclostridium sp.]MCM1385125.1 hypothetical protein [Lachnoclostridium sp.]MCM1465527.1 hypothetical protein [Bacteroidales bacterium]
MLAVKKAKADQSEQKVGECAEPMFSKLQLVRCDKYHDRRDLVDALLDDGKKYTMEQVDKIIEEFMKGKVR